VKESKTDYIENKLLTVLKADSLKMNGEF